MIVLGVSGLPRSQDHHRPLNAVASCRQPAGVGPGDVDLIAHGVDRLGIEGDVVEGVLPSGPGS